jgi:hypothetical protein
VKCTLDQADTRRIVGIAVRQCPEHVDVVRKYDLGREREWSGSLHLADGVSIKIDRNYVTKERRPRMGEKREEI